MKYCEHAVNHVILASKQAKNRNRVMGVYLADVNQAVAKFVAQDHCSRLVRAGRDDELSSESTTGKRSPYKETISMFAFVKGGRGQNKRMAGCHVLVRVVANQAGKVASVLADGVAGLLGSAGVCAVDTTQLGAIAVELEGSIFPLALGANAALPRGSEQGVNVKEREERFERIANEHV